jgi:hypothetical protein
MCANAHKWVNAESVFLNVPYAEALLSLPPEDFLSDLKPARRRPGPVSG